MWSRATRSRAGIVPAGVSGARGWLRSGRAQASPLGRAPCGFGLRVLECERVIEALHAAPPTPGPPHPGSYVYLTSEAKNAADLMAPALPRIQMIKTRKCLAARHLCRIARAIPVKAGARETGRCRSGMEGFGGPLSFGHSKPEPAGSAPWRRSLRATGAEAPPRLPPPSRRPRYGKVCDRARQAPDGSSLMLPLSVPPAAAAKRRGRAARLIGR